MVPIVQKDNPVLRAQAKPVLVEDIGSVKIQKILADMKQALDSQEDGVALAAPQIGASLRIFIISGKVFDLISGKEESDKKGESDNKDIVCINPEIIKLSKVKKEVEEGCLSVRYLYGKTKRAKQAKIKAFDENGRPFELGGSGLLAQIFQHEIDHLNGILFTDTATDVHDLPPKNQ
jgi:peptide deformylase